MANSTRRIKPSEPQSESAQPLSTATSNNQPPLSSASEHARRTLQLHSVTTPVVLGALVLAFGLACWLGPKDDYSESERRPLSSFPTLDASAIASGRFMDQFEGYAQDAFPFRDAFRTAKALASEDLFLKMDNNGLYTVRIETTEGTFSYTQGMQPVDFAEPNGSNAADTPTTTTRTSIAALEYPLNETSVVRATERFRFVYEQYLAGAGANVYASVIPDKGYYLAEPSGHLTMDYNRLFQLMAEGMPYATYLDITQQLSGSSYYLTDPHWRQEALPEVAAALLEGMGAKTTLGETLQAAATPYQAGIATSEFYGSYYGQAALPVQPDTLAFLTNDVIDAATAFDHENNRALPVYDFSKVSGTEGSVGTANKTDPYDLFLGGPLSLVTIDSPLASTDRHLVVFRDSFASSLAPLLLEGYAHITLVDIRYIQPALLGKLIDFEGADVLFLYSTSVLNNSETIR